MTMYQFYKKYTCAAYITLNFACSAAVQVAAAEQKENYCKRCAVMLCAALLAMAYVGYIYIFSNRYYTQLRLMKSPSCSRWKTVSTIIRSLYIINRCST